MPPSAGTIGDVIRPSLLEFIQKRAPNFDPDGFICFNDLGPFRRDYVKEVLQEEVGELSALDQEVIDSLQEREILSANIGKEFDKELTFGERLSDRIASFGGSWRFIMIFGGVLVVWIIINTVLLATRAFDPYPFILMNLILSCLAALQAPIIMMSQNRQSSKDKLLAENDYQVNLKAEMEIAALMRGQAELMARLAMIERTMARRSAESRPQQLANADQ